MDEAVVRPRLTHGGEAIDERPAVIHLKAKVSSM